MIVLGITGSIGMGKSVAAAQLRALGVPVHDADAAVHDLMAPGGAAVAAIAKAFPGVVANRAIDRALPGSTGVRRRARTGAARGDPPSPGAAPACPLHRRRAAPAEFRWSRSTCRSCSRPAARASATQWRWSPSRLPAGAAGDARVRHDKERLAAIRARQMPDMDKRRWADYVIPTGNGSAPRSRACRHRAVVAGQAEALGTS